MANELDTASTADVIIIGAGVTGIHQLHRLRSRLTLWWSKPARTWAALWYRNRYPGARLTRAYSYGYFSQELLDEWNGRSTSPARRRPSGTNHVTDKLDLRGLMRFRTRIASAAFDEASTTWTLTTEDGEQLRCRFLISATGVLSVPYWPAIPG
ncbi:MAG: hypothetical protein R2749_17750 [Acidimicrobiales bacterium]